MGSLSLEQSGDRYVPYVGHIQPGVMMHENAGVTAMLEVQSLPFETASDEDQWSAKGILQNLLRNVGHDRLELTFHVVRGLADPSIYPTRPCVSAWARSFDAAYRDRLLERRLYRNRLYVSIHIKPPMPVGQGFGALLRRVRVMPSRPSVQTLRLLDEAVGRLTAGLERYGPRRLGLRRDRVQRVWFSEIAEALRLILYGVDRPVAVPQRADGSWGRIGRAIYDRRIVWGYSEFDTGHPDPRFRSSDAVYGATLGLSPWPSRTWPGLFDGFLQVPYRGVLTVGITYLPKATAHTRLTRRQNQMINSADPAASQAEALSKAIDQHASNEFRLGEAHVSLTVFARTPEALASVVDDASTTLAVAGAGLVVEDLGNQAAFWAQLPGNGGLRPHPGAITTRNVAGMASLHGFPAGPRRGVWGDPLTVFRSTGGTPIRLHLQEGEVGNTLLVGMTGGGKSVLMNALLALGEKVRAKTVVFDVGRGCEICVRAMEGIYLPLPVGVPSGCAPLKALTGAPDDLEFLRQWITGLVVASRGRGLTPDEGDRLKGALAEIMRDTPPEHRWLADLAAFFDRTDADGVHAHLRQWTRGGAFGWAFDNPADDLPLGVRVLGFEMGAILHHPDVRAPMLSYLFHRIAKLQDGKPFLLAVDEFWLALKDPQFAGLIDAQLRTIRKNNGAVLLATQNPSDMLSSPYAATLIAQSPVQFLLPAPTATRADYVTGLHCTEKEFSLLHDTLPGTRRFLMRRNGRSQVAEMDLTGLDDHLAVLSGRKETVQLLDRIRAEVGDDVRDWMPPFLARWRGETTNLQRSDAA